MKQRLFALITALCMAATALPAVFADGGESGELTIGTSTQEQCSCVALCTEGNINPDCPVCSLDPSACEGAPLRPMLFGAPRAGDVLYLDENGQQKSCSNATEVTSSDQEWNGTNGGWYVAQGDITIGSEDTPQRVAVSGEVHLILADGCTLTVNGGIEVGDGNSLTIYAQSTGSSMGTLIVQNVADFNAGIGGGNGVTGGTIIINGGEVDATGGNYGAGIGGGFKNGGGEITISGGVVTATGGDYGAGIGGGDNGGGGTITIEGGEVTATGGNNAAGIGGGNWGAGGEITINGGEVDATGGINGAGIGGGRNGTGGTITIEGGEVDAKGGGGAAGIGGGYNGAGGEITISDGKVTATGGKYGAGIGGGSQGGGGEITISGGVVTATGGDYGADIGGGVLGSGSTFSTGTDGNAVIFASGRRANIEDKSKQDSWQGIIFEGTEGKVYGTNVTPTQDFTIPSDKTLTIEEGKTLTISTDLSMTNEGTIQNEGTIHNEGTIQNDATIQNDGLIDGDGTIQNDGTITGDGTLYNDGTITGDGTITCTVIEPTQPQPPQPTTPKPTVPADTDHTVQSGSGQQADEESTGLPSLWERAIQRIRSTPVGGRLKIYIGSYTAIPDRVLDALRSRAVTATFYDADGVEVTLPAGQVPPANVYASWTLRQLGNYLTQEQEQQEQTQTAQQQASTPTESATETPASDTGKPNPETGAGATPAAALLVAVVALTGLGFTLKRR